MRNHSRINPATITALSVLLIGALPVAAEAKVRIRVWHPWAGTQGSGLAQAAKLYEKANPKVTIEMVSVPNQIETNEKFFTSMAAGTPPEIILVDGTQVCQWAVKGVLTPLDSLAKKDNVRAGDFWTPSWKQCVWKGKLYSMPFTSDPNFPMAYNKQVLAECGLGDAPKTFAQFEEFARKMDKTDGTNYQRAGAAPMAIPWWGNILYTWGWAFGADFYDDAKDVYKLDGEQATESMNWLTSFYSRRGPKFTAVAGQGYAGLIKGKIGMMPILSDFTKYLSTDKSAKGFQGSYGSIVGPVENPSAWVGGWTMAVPANAKNQGESWKFMKWLCWEKQGTDALFKAVGWMPSARTSPVYSTKQPDDVSAFVDTLKIAKHNRPVSLATPFVFGVLETLGPKMFSGKMSASQALKEANVLVQKELVRLMAKVRIK